MVYKFVKIWFQILSKIGFCWWNFASSSYLKFFFTILVQNAERNCNLKKQCTTARTQIWELKKNQVYRLTFFSTIVRTVRPVWRISAYLFLQIGSFFWSFRKFTKKSILNHFSCIFPYREVIGKIWSKTPLSATYMVKNMPSKCLKNAKLYFF